MFNDPRENELGDANRIVDDIGGGIGGGGGGIVPPPIDDPPPGDTTPPIINNLAITPSSINLSVQNPSAVVTITAKVYDLESIISNVHLNGLGATSIVGITYTWIKTYYYSSFSSGNHTQNLVLSCSNSNGLTSTDSINLTVIVESEKPKDFQVPTINSFSVDDNTVSLNNTQTTQTVTFTANITDNVNVAIFTVSNSTFDRKEGDVYYFTKTFSFNDYSFGDTTDSFTLVAADDAGNLSTKSINIVITKTDTLKPTINSFTANNTSVSLTTSSQSISVTFNASVTDNVGISSVNLPGTSLVFTNNNSYVFSKTYYYNSYSLGNSTDTLTLTVTDTNANSVSNSININITKTDTQSPNILSFSANDTSVTLNTSNSQTQLVTFSAEVTDNHALNSVTLPNTSSLGSNGNIYTFSKLFEQDQFTFGNTLQTFILTATDNTGNSTTASESITISKTDTSGPNITSFTSSLNNFELKTSSQIKIVTFTVVVNDNVAVETITVSGAIPLNNGGGGDPPIDAPPGDEIIIDETKIVEDQIQLSHSDSTPGTSNTFQFVKTYQYSQYSYGSNTDNVICTVTDLNSNVVTSSLTINFTKTDDQSPTISSFLVNNSTLIWYSSSNSDDKTATFTAVVSDNVGVSSISINGGSQTNLIGNSYTFTKSFSRPSLGSSISNAITLSVKDSALNQTSNTIYLTTRYIDNTPPTISSFLTNITNVLLNTNNTLSQTVTFTAVVTDNVFINNISLPNTTFVNNVGNTYTYTSLFESNDYSFGSTLKTFTISATDVNSNSSSSSVTLTVTKSDSSGPVISSFSANFNNFILTTSIPTKSIIFSVIVADNVSVKTITVSGAIPLIGTPPGDPPIDGPPGDEIIIDENKIINDAISLQPGDTSSGTSNRFFFIKNYQYNDYNFGSNTDIVICTVTDFTDNVSTSNLIVNITKSDDQPPTIVSFTPNNNTLTWYSSNLDNSDKSVNFTVVVNDNKGIQAVSVNDATQTNVSGNTYTFSKLFQIPSTISNNNPVISTVTATDTDGNVSTDTTSVNLQYLDDSPPVISLFSASDTSITLNSSNNTSQTVTFSAIVADNVGINSVTINPNISLNSAIGNNYNWSKVFQSSQFSFGSIQQTYTLTVVDNNGLTTTDTEMITITKSDSSGPSISSFTSSSTNFTLSTTSQTKIVTFTVVVADNVSVQTITVSGAVPILDIPSDDDDEIIIDEDRINDQIIQLQPGDTTPGTSNTFRFRKTYSYNDYNFGSNSDQVIATVTDNVGNSSTANLNINITKIDNQPPNISSFTADNTIINLTTEGATSLQTVTFTAVITDNIFLNDITLPNTSFVGNLGNTYTYTSTFDSDEYSLGSTLENFTISATDINNNSSSASLILTIIKNDNTGPVISVFLPDFSTISVSSLIKTKIVRFTVVVADNVFVRTVTVSGATPIQDIPDDDDDEIIIDENKIIQESITLGEADTTPGTFNTFRFQKIYNYDDYVYGQNEDNVTCTVTDFIGNVSTAQTIIVINKVDDAPPTIISFTSDKSVISLSNSYNTELITFTAIILDNVSLSSVSLPGASLQNNTGSIYTFTKTYSVDDFNIGNNVDTLILTATDTANNTSNRIITISITKTDDTGPVISNFISNPSSVNLTTSSQNKIVTFTANVTDNIALSAVLLSGATFQNVIAGNYTWTKSYSYNDYDFGSFTDSLTLTAIDTNNNSVTQTMDLAINKGDDLSPTISSFISSKTIVNLYSTVKTVLVYFYVTATDNVSVSGVTVNGATFVSQSGSIYTFQKSFNYVNYSYGETINSITATATDGDGNNSSTSLSVTVNKYDNEVPVISSLSTNLNSVILNSQNTSVNLQISVVCSDNQSIASVTMSNATQILITGSTYLFQKTYNLQDYNIGIFTDTFTAVVTDPAGNQVSDSITINIDKQDEIPPVISSFLSSITNVVLTQNDDISTISFTITATDNFLIDTISIPGANFISQNGNDFTFQKTYNYVTTTEAETIDPITVTVRDTYNNITDDTINIIIEKIVYNYTIQDNIPYYIEATVNLNKNVSLVNNNTGINGGIIRHTNTHFNVNYKLPTGNTTITMMNFDAKQGTTLLNTYTLDVNVSVDQNGTLSTTHEVKGTDTIGFIQDTADTVNYAYWDVENEPTLTVDMADRLTTLLTTDKIEAGKAAAINSVISTYQGVSVLQSWTIQLSSIMPSLSNFINQYRLAKNRPVGRVFENGEQVVLSTTQDYQVVIPGVDGSSHTLVNPTTIKAIITHQDSAPELERV